jgi:hypothetical protein
VVFYPFLTKSHSLALNTVRVLGALIAVVILSTVVVAPQLIWVVLMFGLPSLMLTLLCFHYERGMHKRLVFLHSLSVPMLLLILPLVTLIFSYRGYRNIKDDGLRVHGMDVSSRNRYEKL